eukprot:COSAG02_NODE_3861_length_6130_cov_16.333112_6_plen_287_part_00
MQIIVRLLNAGHATGRQISPDVEGQDLVEKLRAKIEELAAPLIAGDDSLSSAAAHQAIYFGKILLEDGHKLAEYGVQLESEFIVSLRPKDRMLRLDVGGASHGATLATLMAVEGSRLWAAFQAATHNDGTVEEGLPREPGMTLAQAPDGAYTIDRDGIAFRHVLNFLRARRPVYRNGIRTGSAAEPVVLPDGRSELQQLSEEARYYGLEELEALANRSLAQSQAKSVEHDATLQQVVAILGPCPAGAMACTCVRSCGCKYCKEPLPKIGGRRCWALLVRSVDRKHR